MENKTNKQKKISEVHATTDEIRKLFSRKK